jgi:hypothetical protein
VHDDVIGCEPGADHLGDEQRGKFLDLPPVIEGDDPAYRYGIVLHRA